MAKKRRQRGAGIPRVNVPQDLQDLTVAELEAKIAEFRNDRYRQSLDAAIQIACRDGNRDSEIGCRRMLQVYETQLTAYAKALAKAQMKEAANAKREAARARLNLLKAQASVTRDLKRRLARKLRACVRVTENCPYCLSFDMGAPHLDHIVPLAYGGLSIESNLVYICSQCNEDKAARSLIEFLQDRNLDPLATFERLRRLGKRIG